MYGYYINRIFKVFGDKILLLFVVNIYYIVCDCVWGKVSFKFILIIIIYEV